MEDSGAPNFLGDFLISIEHTPNDVRGNFDLVRDLDREVTGLQEELRFMQAFYIKSRLQLQSNSLNNDNSDMIMNSCGSNSSNNNNNNNNNSSSSSSSSSSIFSSNMEESQCRQSNISDDVLSLNSDKVDSFRVPTIAEIHALSAKINQRLSYKTVIMQKMAEDIDSIVRKLESDLAFLETELKGCGEFENIKGIPPGSEVALRIPLADDSMGIILGRILFYHAELAVYDVADSDDSKRYTISESNIFLLNVVETQRKLSKGELVFAVYPETTSFYLAVVSQLSPISRKKSADAMQASGSNEPSVMVQFHGDTDEAGQLPMRSVPIKYIIRPPN